MFSRILTKIGTKSPTSNQRASDHVSDPSTEGFLCPSCMVGFPTVESLQNHYEISHMNLVNGGEEKLSQSNDEWSSLQEDFVDLQASSKGEQKNYEESRMKLRLLQSADQGNGNQSSHATLEPYLHQIEVLEENNSLVLSEVVLLKQQLEECKLDREVLGSEKTKLEQKAALLAGDLATVQSCLDETKTENKFLKAELSVNQAEVQRLTSETLQRLGAEDAAVLRQELISVQKMMDMLTLESEAEKEAIMKKCKIIEEEKACLEQELKNILPADQTQLNTVLQELDAVKQELEKEKWEVFKFKDTCASLQEDLVQKNTLLEEKSSESLSLLELQQDLSKQITELHSDRERLELENSEKDREMEGLRKELVCSKEHCACLNSQNEKLQQELLDRNNKVSELEHSIEEWESKVSRLHTERDKLKGTVEHLETERKELFTQIDAGDGTETAITQLQQENASLQEHILQQAQLTKAASEEAHRQHENLIKQLQETNTQHSTLMIRQAILEAELQETRTSLSESKSRDETHLQERKEMSEKLIASEKNNSVLKANSENKHHQFMMANSALGKVAADLTRTQSELKELTLKLQEEQNNSQKVKDQNHTQVKNLTLELETLAELLRTSKADMNILQQAYREKESDWSRIHMELNESIKEVDLKLQAERKIHEEDRLLLIEKEKQSAAAVANVKQELHAVKVSLEVQEEQVRKVTNELENALTEREALLVIKQIKEDMGEKMFQLESEYAQLSKVNETLSAQNVKQENQLQECCKNEQDLMDQVQALEQETSSHREEFKAERLLAKKVLSEVIMSKEVVLAERIEAQAELDKIKEELNEMKLLRQSELTDSEAKLVDFGQRLQDSYNELAKLQESYAELECRLEEERTKQEARICVHLENQSTLKQDLCQQLDKVEELHLRLTDVSGQKLELEAKLDNALDERRALLERFIGIEEECEKLRKETGELRNKVIDTLAALHELGRENQTLQIENAKLHQRKWTRDSEVTQCTSCRRMFSVTVRKHHCRSCGSIFCKDCSSKTATLASYRKAVRVCEGCFEEVGG